MLRSKNLYEELTNWKKKYHDVDKDRARQEKEIQQMQKEMKENKRFTDALKLKFLAQQKEKNNLKVQITKLMRSGGIEVCDFIVILSESLSTCPKSIS